ncbi:FecR family protein [Pedobacter frigiditerrae]|uniref:FecR family protein n=1 Tax=Pedobacter frigiditerrae TaxID=2530452 RepID=A0A4R0MML8_9SPHI|nr:FecR family protein [Pedobacter frigiditerrae]TCC87960.1 FecR family protein [Pedobacter frigiditerrae]
MKKPKEQTLRVEILAEKLLNNTITTEEFKELEAWYAEVSEKPAVWDLTDANTVLLQQRIFDPIKNHVSTTRETRKLWQYISIAASILLICSAGLWIWQSENQKDDVIAKIQTSTSGKIIKVYLPDQSIVWLKGNSRLDYPSKFSDSTRNVTLHGEALFEVAKDKRHPFVIQAGKYVTRVLGTSFNINENQINKTFRLTVFTGKVAVFSSSVDRKNKTTSPIIVTPGNEFAVLNPSVTPRVIAAPSTEKAEMFYGTEYDMNFENVGFNEVKQRIEKKFNILINADSDKYSYCTISADVTDQSLESTLKVICSALDIKYSINKDQITLTGGGCN